MERLKDKIALITGGGQGIGKAAAGVFAEEGAMVVVVDINETTGNKTTADIQSRGYKAYFIRSDVSINNDVKNLFRIIKKKFTGLHILYNNASIYLPGKDGRVVDIKEDIWDRVVAVNLKSIYLMCKHCIPLMIENGGGSIINTSSSAGVIGIPNCDAYTAPKGATIALTRSLAVEYGPHKIRVNCIAPAAVRSPMLDQSSLDDTQFDEKRFLTLRTPLRRYGEPEEIAQIAAFLASDESSYLNGAVIVADGGITVNGDLSKTND
ncbi:MAG: glucose 1-dehydrogenase [Spirochaetota bacterium]|nr:MAG: glucose 1-dehydrogenase [Spirochaetota bacterium]